MSTVTINYQFKTFKVKVTPSTNLNDVLRQSLSHFKVDQNAIQRWSLLYKGKEISMDLPWRLLNLPAGCKMDLIPSQNDANAPKPKDSNTIKSKSGSLNDHASSSSSVDNGLIKIRFQVSGGRNVIQQVNPMDSIIDTLKMIGKTNKWDELCSNDTLQRLKFRVMSSVYDYSRFNSKSFDDLGIRKSVSINIEIPSHTIYASKSNGAETISTGSNTSDIEIESLNETKHELHRPVVYLPSADKISIEEDTNDDDNIYELSIEHAKIYQNMLSKQTGNLGGPLLTKRLREEKMKQMNAVNRQNVKECLVRIKFPDRTYLEIAFKPDETMRNVYQEISKNLLDDQLKFNLYQTHPHVLLLCDNQLLVDDLNFRSKNVIILEFEDSTKKGPFLKDTILADAKFITETIEGSSHLDSKDSNQNSTTPTNNDASSQTIRPKKSLNGMPKWLRLSKK